LLESFLSLDSYFFFGGPSQTGGNLSPYDVLGVTKEMSKKEIARVYRKLSIIYHPDKNQGNEEGNQKYIQIGKAFEILNDDKKIENWEKFGNPNGPDQKYYEDKYPEFIVNPPKSFIYIYLLVIFIVIGLPLALFVIPLLKSPPQVFCDAVEGEMKIGETLLGEHKKEAIPQIQKALDLWKSLVKTFPRYESSIYQTIYHFRAVARIAQYKIYDGDVEGANSELVECRKLCNGEHLKTKEVRAKINPIIDNLLQTIDSCGLSKSKDQYIRSIVSSFKK